MTDAGASDSFPRQAARTRRFTVGAPRTFRISDDGRRVLFLRSPSGQDPRNELWLLDLATGKERVVARVREAAEDDVPEAERDRRERVREVGSGILAYDADASCTTAVTAVDGRLYLVHIDGDPGDNADGTAPTALTSPPGAFDPRIAPTGQHIAYVVGRDLRLAEVGGDDRVLVESDGADISWGSAEFVAAEELGRLRGHWWSPDGQRLAVARVDVSAVARWYLADPSDPAAEPRAARYPVAGSENADVSVEVVDLAGDRRPLAWDRRAFPYLVDVAWEGDGLLVTVQSRDQREVQILLADPNTGETACARRQVDDAWVDIVPGSPAWLDGKLVTVEPQDQSHRVLLDGAPVTPPGLQIRRVVRADAASGTILFTASADNPTVVDAYRVDPAGQVSRLTGGDGVHHVLAAGGDAVVTWSDTPDGPPRVRVWRDGAVVATVASLAEAPLVEPRPDFRTVGARRLRTAVLFPSVDRGDRGDPGDRALPVVMDPYGGPHHQRVMFGRSEYLSSQWLADQGFAVVVVDGRGTPGRGPAWERAVLADLAGPVLEDQIDALQALAATDHRIDLSRVAIRGWSFGGYLAALAVLRRPDLFHAAIAGAPVTDWRLYDTHYTERYLGHPDSSPDNYERSSLIADAPGLSRPLLLIHGLADDNVVVAHTLRLSHALLAAGRPHRVLPITNATHLARDEAVAENLLRLQVDFLRETLGPG